MSSSTTFIPTTRSRTLLFISYRDSSARAPPTSRSSGRQYQDAYHTNDENEGLIDHQGTPHISLDVELPPKWVDYVEQVEEILAATHAKVAALDKLHAKHVLPGFADRTTEEREIQVATNEITKDFRQCQALIQLVQHHALAAKNTQRGLAAKVQELTPPSEKGSECIWKVSYLSLYPLTPYVDIPRTRLTCPRVELQGHAIKNQDLLLPSGVSPDSLDQDVEATSPRQLVDQQQLQPDLTARDRELTEIAKSIATLAELFKDLSSLVIDQGTLLDSVEYNIEQTAVHMDESVKELDMATRYQKNTGRRKCIFLLLLIIFGLILVLIFKPRRHSSAPAPTPISTQALKSHRFLHS
ncbi:t-SNARE [Lactifluus volemus]|nr:t-SNARE [Lactifluus volemus]